MSTSTCRGLVPAVGGITLAGLLAVGTAQAQEPARGTGSPERIEVTGTRITGPDVESASPVFTVTAEDVRIEGYQSVELILNNLPQIVGDQGNRLSNFSTGTATVDLRGILPGRTLVLLNGRRMAAGSPRALAADINQIPVALIKRVDVLTGGAAAVYGSDAIAGVVNFILDDRFEGVQGTIHHDFYNHRQKSPYAEVVRAHNYALPGDRSSDGETTSLSLLMGGNFAAGRGNAAVSFSYLDTRALLWADRDYSACALSLDPTGRQVICGGSTTGFPGRFIDFNAGRQWTMDAATGRVRPWSRATDLYNFAPLNYFQRPAERYGFAAFGNYEISPAARAYAEFLFHDDHTVAQIAASGIFGSMVTRVRFENPLLTDEWRQRLGLTRPGSSVDLIIQRRNVEAGGRQAGMRHTSFREVAGVKGSIAKDWDYDVSLQAGKVVFGEVYRNDVSLSRAARALDVVSDPATGRPVCASVLDGSDPGCVPYDVWRPDGVTPAALAYITTPGLQSGFTSQRLFTATVSGDLGGLGLRFPRAGANVEVVVGAERRVEQVRWEPDTAFQTGDLAGQGRSNPPASGAMTVNDVFGEVRVPVLASLNLSGSYRHSDMSIGKTTDTFGIGFNFVPTAFARARGSFQRAVRAPNLLELFQPRAAGEGAIRDPCAGQAPTRTLAECQRTGMTPQQYGRLLVTESLGFLAGGNPQLGAEKADTFTLGVAVTPLRGFSATIDYFDIRLKDTIDIILPGVTLNECLATGNPLFCSLITRNAFGAGTIDITSKNIGRVRVSGVDVAAHYKHVLWGRSSIGIDLIGTYTRHRTYEPYPGAGGWDCAGLFGNRCERPTPLWRHRLRATWSSPWSVDFAATWRYFHSVHDSVTSSDPALAGPIREPVRKIRAMNYLDVAAAWYLTKQVTLRAGSNNVTDRDPPFMFGINGNTEPHSYDPLGRYVYVNLGVRF